MCNSRDSWQRAVGCGWPKLFQFLNLLVFNYTEAPQIFIIEIFVSFSLRAGSPELGTCTPCLEFKLKVWGGPGVEGVTSLPSSPGVSGSPKGKLCPSMPTPDPKWGGAVICLQPGKARKDRGNVYTGERSVKAVLPSPYHLPLQLPAQMKFSGVSPGFSWGQTGKTGVIMWKIQKYCNTCWYCRRAVSGKAFFDIM